MLTSGRTKIPGLKVRMELAWQKEREEHQRLLQETATLARDLRQTLFEVHIKLKLRIEFARQPRDEACHTVELVDIASGAAFTIRPIRRQLGPRSLWGYILKPYSSQTTI